MSWKKVASVKESPTIVTTCTKVTQELADGSIRLITTTSLPYAAPKKARDPNKKVATPIRPRATKKRSAESNKELTAPVSKKPSAESDNESPVSKKSSAGSDTESPGTVSTKPYADSETTYPVAIFKNVPTKKTMRKVVTHLVTNQILLNLRSL